MTVMDKSRMNDYLQIVQEIRSAGINAEVFTGERHTLGVITGRGGDHASPLLRVAQMENLVIGPAQLEGEHRLQVLALEQHIVL